MSIKVQRLSECDRMSDLDITLRNLAARLRIDEDELLRIADEQRIYTEQQIRHYLDKHMSESLRHLRYITRRVRKRHGQ